MKTLPLLIAAPALLALAACGGSEAGTSNTADDFAARINGNNPASAPNPAATNAPQIAKPLPGAAEGAYVPGTLTDPESAICAANQMGPYIGKEADNATKLAIMEAAKGAGEVRFILPGGANVNPDPTNPRLNIMIDNLNIIRDARCG